ncbi:Sodium-dependent noradrenaline transporter [Takifugu flavidus]|uniref:Sodium-dependent noradrenaline transporter n=1 Tax=Takifugu flavidus TaxID=433684 RepID=A0A5C6NRV5_9TELE|nr:Sodium-dependent noradrenaline transporter [Takifugu flavidus]
MTAPRNSVHKNYEQNRRQRAALAETNPHRKRVRLTASNSDQTLAPIIRGADGPYQRARHPILLENPPQDPSRDTVECLNCSLYPKVGLICSFLNYQPLKSRGGYVYPDWSYHLGLAMALSSMVVIPVYAVAKLCFTKGTLKQRLLVLWYPDRGAAHPKRNGHESETIHSSDI